MIVIDLAAVTSATAALAFEVDMNTNNGITYNTTENNILIQAPGIYEIVGDVTVKSTTEGNYGIEIYSSGIAYGNASIASAAAAAETVTIPIYDVLNIDATTTNSFVTLTVMPTGTPTIVSGTISIKKIS